MPCNKVACNNSALSFSSHVFFLTESEAEEPGNEGADGPDEEPPVGRQCHAHHAKMTAGRFLVNI